MLRLKPYEQDKNYSTVRGLYELNGMAIVDKCFLPSVGHIAYDDRTPIAAGFLLCTDTSLCIMEYFVSNPNVDWKLRSDAIIMITKELIEDARFLGFSSVAASFKSDRLAEKAKETGFKVEKKTSNWATLEVLNG